MLSVPLACFIFLHSTYHDDIPCILLIYFVVLPQPHCKLHEARDFAFVHFHTPGMQKDQCLVVSRWVEAGTAFLFAPADWPRGDQLWCISILDAQLSLMEKSPAPAFCSQLSLFCELSVDDFISASTH